MDARQEQYLKFHREKKANEALLREIKELQSFCLELANEKVTIAKQTEQLVERCKERLKADFNRWSQNVKNHDHGEERSNQDYCSLRSITTSGKERKIRSQARPVYWNTNLSGANAYQNTAQPEIYCFCEKTIDATLIGCDDPDVDFADDIV